MKKRFLCLALVLVMLVGIIPFSAITAFAADDAATEVDTFAELVAAVNEGIAETMTPYEFGIFWIDKCGRDANIINDGAVYCEYYSEDVHGEAEVFYLEAFYRSAYAYFVILFAAPTAEEEAGRVDFLNYAKSVYFNI